MAFRVVQRSLAPQFGTDTKALLHLSSWSVRGSGGQMGVLKDEGLAGGHGEDVGHAGERAWEALRPGKDIGERAKAWLEKKLGPTVAEGGDVALSPKEPVAPGATWNPDPTDLAKVMGKGSLEIDPAKSSIKVTFVEATPTKAGNFGRFTIEMSLATKSLQSPMGAMEWKEGGALTSKGNMNRSLE